MKIIKINSGKSHLESILKVPAHETWLRQNKTALNKVKTGLSEKGTIKRGSFAEYVED